MFISSPPSAIKIAPWILLVPAKIRKIKDQRCLWESESDIVPLCPRLWWTSSTRAWGTWSTWGRAMRNQSQVNIDFSPTHAQWRLTSFEFEFERRTVWRALSFVSFSSCSDDSRWKGLLWCGLKGWRERHRIPRLQRAWWVSWVWVTSAHNRRCLLVSACTAPSFLHSFLHFMYFQSQLSWVILHFHKQCTSHFIHK